MDGVDWRLEDAGCRMEKGWRCDKNKLGKTPSNGRG